MLALVALTSVSIHLGQVARGRVCGTPTRCYNYFHPSRQAAVVPPAVHEMSTVVFVSINSLSLLLQSESSTMSHYMKGPRLKVNVDIHVEAQLSQRQTHSVRFPSGTGCQVAKAVS